ncbi:MAG: hypothetical protein ACTSYU_07380, partial [Promethearchaeota archaeon]
EIEEIKELEEFEDFEEDDEFDVEKFLKFNPSWKFVLKIAFVIIVIGSLIYFSIVGDLFSDLYAYILLIVCIIGGAFILSLEMEEEEVRQTISTLWCRKCELQKIIRYEDEDFVFKIKGNCPSCGETMHIKEIYTVKVRDKKKKKKPS